MHSRKQELLVSLKTFFFLITWLWINTAGFSAATECGSVIDTEFGTIDFHHDPSDGKGPNLTCVWTIVNQVNLRINNPVFQLSSSGLLENDSLIVSMFKWRPFPYGEPFIENYRMNTSTDTPISLNGSVAIVTFIPSASRNNEANFSLTYNFTAFNDLDISSASVHRIFNPAVTMGFRHGPYTNMEMSTFLVGSPDFQDDGKIRDFVFTPFGIEARHDTVFLYTFDRWNENQNEIGWHHVTEFTENTIQQFRTDRMTLFVFTSELSITDQGFQISWF